MLRGQRTPGVLVALIAGAALAAASPAAAQSPPKMPNTTAGSKRCASVTRLGYSFRVYVVRGKSLVTCARARSIVRRKPLNPIPGWRYYDWTKGGNGPWSDVYIRHDRRAVIGAIIRA